MRRRTLLLAALAVLALAAACHSSTSNGAHWRQNRTDTQRVIEVWMSPTTSSDPFFLRGINHGIEAWNPSPYIHLQLAVDTDGCTPGAHCIDVRRQAGLNGARASWGWDADLHMYANGAHLTFDASPWDPAVLANATCHELGHALALSHSTDGTPGPCQNGQPTAHDMHLVNDNHAHADGTSTFSLDADTRPGTTEVHDTYAELRRGTTPHR